MISKVLLLSAMVAVSLAQYAAVRQHDEIQYPPQPYEFGYNNNDDYGNTAFRKETGDGKGKVSGSYGYKEANGVERVVEYVADENGYRAQIKTNEPGTESKNPADTQLYANPIVVDYVPSPQQALRYQQQNLNKPAY